MTTVPSFAVTYTLRQGISILHRRMKSESIRVHPASWQGVDVSRENAAEMVELTSVYWGAPMPSNILTLQSEVKPNLPWADEHFEERICGFPMNPGEAWKSWPWANKASQFTDAKGRFEVNYMERFWASGPFEDTPTPGVTTDRLTGIRGRPYGDLSSIVELLLKDPSTRQAWMPIYFPEDTGAGGRVPCSLGYHWLIRADRINVFYPIRSCDFYRHFRDDVYLAIRLTLWLLNELRLRDHAYFSKIEPGEFSMWIGSLHVFVNDYVKLFGERMK